MTAMVHRLYSRLLAVPRGSFFLFGMRGTGKSTWLESLGFDALRIDLLDEGLYQRILADPSVFSGLLSNAPPGSWVFVDEVQRLPGILNDVQRFMERRRLKFALTGSSARKLKRGGTNLLAGRAIVRDMFPLLPAELGSDFDLERTLEQGTLPLVVASDPSERIPRLRSYVQTYLKEEIQAEALVRNLGGFARFLPVAGMLNGQILSVASLARECGVGRTTVSGFVEILKDTLLAFEVPGYEAKLRVRERKHPKLYWIDNGVARAARGDFGAVSQDERGALFEAWVAQVLFAYRSYTDLFDDLWYWAPTEARDVEIDFLLRRGRKLIAIEAKVGSRYRPEWRRSLQAVGALPAVKRRIIVYGGQDVLRTPEGIEVLPERAFRELIARGNLF